ncbi:MAG: hypothetical protein HC942_23220 [Microcoleus sp. SU_5_6]|nr:hypothetical protein [Microcoleus sp. SU_5_6]
MFQKADRPHNTIDKNRKICIYIKIRPIAQIAAENSASPKNTTPKPRSVCR